ncbi:hypothetical protein LTR37_019356 [Vermiconidia calcicola]|uniref:Uncharacterized protein n=1 Tax=Vermiconidia calcicola TaxID=1690605 RepID=A0ACC3MFN0_9PEZI|nr:hypothetical protein LTR37_019356 [Vermiconidia calcicola]
MAFVVALQIAMGVWQLVKYLQLPLPRAALGWGVVLAKTSAGVLYPTLFFMLLSMSRHFSTFLRRSYIVSKFINWDLSQAFHIKMSICGLFFASLHAIRHLNGSFLYGSRPGQQDDVERIFGADAVPRPYIRYVRSLPGWSGIVSLGLFWTISLLSMPFIRKRSYEIFQLSHLLMFPMIALLCAHGTQALLQFPMLGYWLAFPALLVIFERSWRFIRGFLSVPARAKTGATQLDNTYSCRSLSSHSFSGIHSPSRLVVATFSKYTFKFDGDWTNKLQEVLPEDEDIRVGIDGPFGAPAQRFYDYNYSIIVGGGIGITPFSAILTDLEEKFSDQRDPCAERRQSRSFSRPGSSRHSIRALSESRKVSEVPKHANPERRVDFHWTVREKNNLLWFSDLLNRAIEGAGPLAKHGNLELNIDTHITAKRKNISTHVFRYLLDSYRTTAAPYSALTGLKQPSHFGRPDFDDILQRHFDELVRSG